MIKCFPNFQWVRIKPYSVSGVHLCFTISFGCSWTKKDHPSHFRTNKRPWQRWKKLVWMWKEYFCSFSGTGHAGYFGPGVFALKKTFGILFVDLKFDLQKPSRICWANKGYKAHSITSWFDNGHGWNTVVPQHLKTDHFEGFRDHLTHPVLRAGSIDLHDLNLQMFVGLDIWYMSVSF